jgi:hypothetical protein
VTLAPSHAENETRPRGLGYGARLGTAWYRLAVHPDAPLTIQTRDQLAERSADGTNAFENMLKTGFAWVRGDFTGGEGLDRYPRTPPHPLDDTRYFLSENLDLRRPGAGRPYSITLSRRHEPWYTAPSTITEVRATVDKLYVAYEDEIRGFLDDGDPSPDTLFAFPAAVVSFDVSDSDEGIALLTNGELWHKPIGTDTWTEITAGAGVLDDITGVWIVKGRVILAQRDPASAVAGKLVDLALGVTGTPAVPTYSVTPFTVDTFAADVLAVEDSGMCVLAITTDRMIRSYVPRSDAAADPPVLALQSLTPMPRGEQPIAVAHSSSKLLILTAHENVLRAYAAVQHDELTNFVIGDLTELRTWESVQIPTNPMQRLVMATRDEFRWLVTTEGEGTDLWRYDLVTTGLHNHVHVDDDHMEGLVVWQERDYTYDLHTDQLSRTSVFYEASGYLITPLINFNLNTDINWTELSIQAFDLIAGGGAQVLIYISSDDAALLDPDHESWRLALSLTSPTIDAQLVPLAGERWPKLALKLELRSWPDGAGSPRVTQVGVRGIPAAQEVVVQLPMSVADQVEAPGRMPVRIPGWGDELFDELLELRGHALDLFLVEPPLRIRGVVTQVAQPVTYISHRGSPGRLCMVEILGDVLAEDASQLGLGEPDLGVALLGVSLLGVGEV